MWATAELLYNITPTLPVGNIGKYKSSLSFIRYISKLGTILELS
jgi:hypothetical protein